MPKRSPTTNETPAVSVRDLSVSYGSIKAVDSISFDIAQGAVAAIIGPNGSGKTTLVKAIIGLVEPDRGDVRLLGKHFHAAREFFGYVPQRFDFDRNFPMTVREFMDLARRLHCGKHFPERAINEKIEEVGLPQGVLDSHLGELSGGQMQRVLIAQAIINDPLVLFLDEPAAGIDIAGEATFYEVLNHLNTAHQTTIVLVTHEIAMISRLVDTVICVNHQMVCYGPPTTALTEKKIEELFGKHTFYYDHDQGHHGH